MMRRSAGRGSQVSIFIFFVTLRRISDSIPTISVHTLMDIGQQIRPHLPEILLFPDFAAVGCVLLTKSQLCPPP